ncbi:MAG: DUF4363 family protein [Clostridia bacterium]|nr:DUF4363 family protein [Clostridia bacterium]
MKRFKREIITLIVIIVFIVGIDLITDKIMKNVVDDMVNLIEDIERKIGENLEDVKIDDLKKVWHEKEVMLAYFSEHDELEKVTVEVTELKSNMENDMKEEAKGNIDKIKFLLKHIEEKEKLKLKNIF